MLVKSFDHTCASCHLEQITGLGRADAPGITVIRLPGLDVQTLAKRNIAIGDWPEGAEGGITPFMELLFRSQTESNNVIQRLRSLDLLDLSKATASQLSDAATLSWMVKEMVHDLSIKGQVEIEGRIKTSLSHELNSAQKEAIAGLLSAEVLQASRNQWFPNLSQEVASHREGKKTPPPNVGKVSTGQLGANPGKPEDWVARGGWYRSNSDYSISYRPTGHADLFLRSWMDLSVANPNARQLFDSLSNPKAPGLCAKCHSTDDRPEPQINWNPSLPDAFEHKFTRFSHVAHFSLLDDHGCQTCHRLDSNASRESYGAAFATGHRDPAAFSSNFKSIDLGLCASCHTRKHAGESCLKCHNYHVGHFVPTLPKQQWGAPQATTPKTQSRIQ